MPALAQSQPRYDDAKQYGAVSVNDTDRPLFKPQGIRIGNYIVSPEIGYATAFSDNIYGSSTSRSSGFRHELSGGVKFTSDLPRHLLDFMVAGRGVAVQDHSDMNFVDLRASMRFRIDIDRNHNIFGSAMRERVHEETITYETPTNARRPIEIVRTRAEAGVMRDVGRVSMTTGARFEQWNFKDVEAYGGSTLDQDYRDLSILSPFVRLGYRPSPGYRLLAEGELNFQRAPGAGSGLDHDARGYRVLAGVEMELSPLVRLVLKGGHGAMQFSNSALQDVSMPIGEARVEWLVTPRLTLHAGAARTLEPVTIVATSARESTKYFAGADAELLNNLVLRAGIERRYNSYFGATTPDQLMIGRISLEYAHTTNWLFTAGYENRLRILGLPETEARENRVTVGVKYRY